MSGMLSNFKINGLLHVYLTKMDVFKAILSCFPSELKNLLTSNRLLPMLTAWRAWTVIARHSVVSTATAPGLLPSNSANLLEIHPLPPTRSMATRREGTYITMVLPGPWCNHVTDSQMFHEVHQRGKAGDKQSHMALYANTKLLTLATVKIL